jgi:hypothetical protein
VAASYPGTIKIFTPKVDNITPVYAEHPNSLQDEVVAMQKIIGLKPHVSTTSNPAHTFLATANDWYDPATNPDESLRGLVGRLANIETGLVADVHSQYLKRIGGDEIQPGSSITTGLRIRCAASQTAPLLQFLDVGGTQKAAFAPDGSLSVNNLTVNGTQTNVAGSATALDMGATTGIAAGTGTNLGDKIQMYSSTYGFGMGTAPSGDRRLVAYVANGSGGFSVRQRSGSGYASSGTDAVTLLGDGSILATGLASLNGGADLATAGGSLAPTGTSLGDKLGLYANTGIGMTDATHLSLFVSSGASVVQVAPANTGAGAKSASLTPGVQLTGSGIGNFKTGPASAPRR